MRRGCASRCRRRTPKQKSTGWLIRSPRACARRARLSSRMSSDSSWLDRAALRRAFDGASVGYDASAVLQARVREELLSRLSLVKLAPEVVLDLGCGTGHGAWALKRRFRRATVIALDLAPGML